ncbi:hypothetical protein L484_024572 [Morus notabilis]|uniref:Uncharacterized protein n=1 Tax=Morus notabilis TaxID=981085 RepID=W9S6W5_9ROSA|nr:hypothetical protein L484_024572 [Morus notabilis]
MSGEDECCKSFYCENSELKTQRFINAGLEQVAEQRVVICRGGAMICSLVGNDIVFAHDHCVK